MRGKTPILILLLLNLLEKQTFFNLLYYINPQNKYPKKHIKIFSNILVKKLERQFLEDEQEAA